MSFVHHDTAFSSFFFFFLHVMAQPTRKKDPTNTKKLPQSGTIYVHEIKYFSHVSINLLSCNVHLNTNKKQKRTFLVYRIFLFMRKVIFSHFLQKKKTLSSIDAVKRVVFPLELQQERTFCANLISSYFQALITFCSSSSVVNGLLSA